MLFNNVAVIGMSYIDAPHIVTSASIEAELSETMQRFNMRPNLIESLTGIRARRFWDEGVQPSDVATQAAVRALEQAGIDRSQVGLVMSTSVCKDYIEPSIACLVHSNLKLSATCLNFDVGNACLAFLNAMTIAGTMLEAKQLDYVLIVDGEGSRFVIEQTLARLKKPECTEDYFRASFATLTLGSGAAAMVLTRADKAPQGHRFLGGVSLAATEHSRLCLGQPHEMLTDAKTLLVEGVKLAHQTYQKAKTDLDWDKKEFAQLILHQVGESNIRKLCEVLGLNREKIPLIFPDFGNIGPAAIPITLAKTAEANVLSPGDRVALLGIGSGLNCTMMEMVW